MKVTIELTTEDAEKYKKFCQYYNVFSVLVERKVFETKGGSCEIHFDLYGNIGSIVRHESLYRRDRESS